MINDKFKQLKNDEIQLKLQSQFFQSESKPQKAQNIQVPIVEEENSSVKEE